MHKGQVGPISLASTKQELTLLPFELMNEGSVKSDSSLLLRETTHFIFSVKSHLSGSSLKNQWPASFQKVSLPAV